MDRRNLEVESGCPDTGEHERMDSSPFPVPSLPRWPLRHEDGFGKSLGASEPTNRIVIADGGFRHQELNE